MNFWLRNIILGAFLITLAWGFLANQDFLLSLDSSLEKVNKDAAMTSEATTNPNNDAGKSKTSKYQQGKNSTNAAADGLSRFYANLHGDMDEKGPQIRNNIVYLPKPKGNLTELLQAREMMVRPYKSNWRGSIKSRPFRRDQTLNQKLSEYSEEDGLELIWWLNRDYIIKDPFRIEKDILKTNFQVAKAIEGHFPSGLSIFFCNRHRAVVVIESSPQPYLDEECMLLDSKSTY